MFLQKQLREEHERLERAAGPSGVQYVPIDRPLKSRPIRYAVPLSPAPGSPLLDRGVWTSPFLDPDGHAVLFAVDTRHRCLAKAVVMDPREWEALDAHLASYLDEQDPVFQLRAI